jgi:hypothetical protein
VSGAPSRIEEARRRALGAKQAAVALAAAGFLAVLLLARGSHPGQASTSSSSSGSSGTQAGQESSDGGFDFGSGSVAPSTGTPQTQSSVS